MGRPKKQKLTGFDAIKDSAIVAVDGKSRTIDNVFVKGDFKKSKDGKNLYVLYESLQRVFREIFGATLEYDPVVNQCPTKTNEWCAVVTVSYQFIIGDDKTSVRYGATADCRIGNATGYKEYTTAVAETRASARALRNILGLNICSIEEISDVDSVIDGSMNDPAEGTQLMLIKKKILGEKKWEMSKIVDIIGREVKDLEDLTKTEAMQVIDAFNSC